MSNSTPFTSASHHPILPDKTGPTRSSPTLLWLLGVLLLPSSASFAATDYIDNGTIKIGIDLVHGGGINYLSDSGSSYNVVNVADYGRYIQQSYYSGPQPYIPDGAALADGDADADGTVDGHDLDL